VLIESITGVPHQHLMLACGLLPPLDDHGGHGGHIVMLHESVTGRILEAAMKVHRVLGAGMLESAYHRCLHYQLGVDGLHFQHQVRLPVVYQRIHLDAGYRIDFLVENCVIVELKAVEKLLPVHTAQLLSYLKLSGRHVGLLINFNVPHLRQGIRRVVNGYPP
jgi:GxxExxY protein